LLSCKFNVEDSLLFYCFFADCTYKVGKNSIEDASLIYCIYAEDTKIIRYPLHKNSSIIEYPLC